MWGNILFEKCIINSVVYFILGDEFGLEMEDVEVEYDWNWLVEL